MATEIPEKVLDAYASRFAPEFEKGHTMVPVEAQDEKTKAWKVNRYVYDGAVR